MRDYVENTEWEKTLGECNQSDHLDDLFNRLLADQGDIDEDSIIIAHDEMLEQYGVVMAPAPERWYVFDQDKFALSDYPALS